MALHQILVYGNYRVEPEERDFLVKDYIFDFPELLTKGRIDDMIRRGIDSEYHITDVQIVRE